MALPLPPTLEELRSSVLLRCGMATAGSAPASITPVVDERIRQAQKILHTNMAFSRLWVRARLDLAEGQPLYDWPDGILEGDLRRLIAVRDDGWEFELEPGLRPNERNSAYRSSGSGLTAPVHGPYAPMPPTEPPSGDPLRWGFENEQIRLAPAPSADWTHLVFEGTAAPATLVSNTDRCSVDSEALLMLAELLVKKHFGMPAVDSAEAVFEQYLEDLRSKQGDGDGFQIGGQQPLRCRPWVRDRIARPPLFRDSYRGWRPW